MNEGTLLIRKVKCFAVMYLRSWMIGLYVCVCVCICVLHVCICVASAGLFRLVSASLALKCGFVSLFFSFTLRLLCYHFYSHYLVGVLVLCYYQLLVIVP